MLAWNLVPALETQGTDRVAGSSGTLVLNCGEPVDGSEIADMGWYHNKSGPIHVLTKVDVQGSPSFLNEAVPRERVSGCDYVSEIFLRLNSSLAKTGPFSENASIAGLSKSLKTMSRPDLQKRAMNDGGRSKSVPAAASSGGGVRKKRKGRFIVVRSRGVT